MYNKNYYVNCKINSNKRYENVYKLDTVIKKYVEIYKEVATKKMKVLITGGAGFIGISYC